MGTGVKIQGAEGPRGQGSKRFLFSVCSGLLLEPLNPHILKKLEK